ncbi:uncharacterized protein LOC115097351 [Rhinatrema bivittatum]|uniref:uncharacterized protein LOC115097351 n=1 Tax=Rhinatrema bivittatum TaxID=194408 RepID=UPI00112C5305|nr:uncharacterized protein LOC115097351 [Rhinatrema bivittatum]
MAPIRRDRGHAKKVSSQQISHGASMPDGAPMPDASASNDAVARTPRRSRSPRRSPNAERQPPTSTQRRGNRATSVTPPDNADIEHLVNEIRAQAVTHGTEWVRQHMATFNSSTTHNAPKRVHAASKKKVPSKKVPSQRSSKSSAGQSSGPTAPSTASASTRSQRGASTRTERNSRSLHTSSRATNTSGDGAENAAAHHMDHWPFLCALGTQKGLTAAFGGTSWYGGPSSIVALEWYPRNEMGPINSDCPSIVKIQPPPRCDYIASWG